QLHHAAGHDHQLMTAEGVLKGAIPAIALSGGNMEWAIGAQYRWFGTQNDVSNIANFDINPCIEEGAPLSSCQGNPRGPMSIFTATQLRGYDQSVSAEFAELSLPFSDTFNVNFAIRHESHDAGDTVNPKISAKWQFHPDYAIRGSVGTAYRTPSIAQLDPSLSASLTAAFGATRVPVTLRGNPDIKPETSTSYNFGFIANPGNFSGRIDYWRYDLKDQLITEDAGALIEALLPTGQPDRCSDPAFQDLAARFQFNAAGCGTVAGIARVDYLNVNGPDTSLDGIDVSASYLFENVLQGDLSLGFQGTYNFRYQVDAREQYGIEITPAYDAVGLFNASRDPNSLPQYRGQIFANWERENQNLRAVANYIDGIDDERAGNGKSSDLFSSLPGYPLGTFAPTGAKIDSFFTIDLHYLRNLPRDAKLSLSVSNLLDENPPFARTDRSYDAFIGSPLGRVFKVGLSKEF
ncbi:TonB-dependent receptor domain-containing protein, partial [Hyphomonas oceanitis]